MKTKTSKTEQTEQESPRCRKCGGTNIEFKFWDPATGQNVEETGTIREACYYIAEAAKEEVDQGCSAERLQVMGTTLAGLASMLLIREQAEEEEKHEPTPTQGAQS
jgi:hypothetical protein